MKIPVGAVFDLFAGPKRTGRSAQHQVVRLSVMVVAGTFSELVDAARAGLLPKSAAGRIHVEGVAADDALRVTVNSLSDAALVLVGARTPAAAAARIWRDFASVGVPCLIVGQAAAEEAERLSQTLAQFGVPKDLYQITPQADEAIAWAGRRLAGLLPEELSQLAAQNFPCVRRAAAQEVVVKSSTTNAVVAAGGALPAVGGGADIVAMTAVQFSMAGGIADLYQVDDVLERTVEGVALMAAAPLWRLVARGLSRALPLPPLVVRIAVGALGTYAGGAALAAYHEGELFRTHDGQPTDAANWIRARFSHFVANREQG